MGDGGRAEDLVVVACACMYSVQPAPTGTHQINRERSDMLRLEEEEGGGGLAASVCASCSVTDQASNPRDTH